MVSIVCIIVGALNDALSRMSASWADSKDRRPTAVLSSVQRLARDVSIFLPVKVGHPAEDLPRQVPER